MTQITAEQNVQAMREMRESERNAQEIRQVAALRATADKLRILQRGIALQLAQLTGRDE